ncbi:MAG: helix-turn-helix transcriptional regulator [Clostridium sp.]
MLGDKIKFLRKEKGITQQELSTSIGVSRSSIGMVEKNLQGVSRKTLVKLADFFNVTVDSLLSEEDSVNLDATSNSDISNKEFDFDTIPIEFTNPDEARSYVSKHKIFGAHGFDVNKLNDEEILAFANELLKQMEMVSFKYKK